MADEKKEDDRHDLMQVASPTKSDGGYRSKIDDILFEDGLPPSPPDLSFKKSPTSLVKSILQGHDSQSESPPSSPESAVDGEGSRSSIKLPGTPPMKPARSVKFNMNDSPGSSFNLDEASEESLLDRLTRTQDRLTQALIDLSGEKAMRKRKEKNLVKLAKELQKRAGVLEAKDKQIIKMTNVINRATDNEQQVTVALKAAEEKHRSMVMDFESRISALTTQHIAECATLEQKYRTACTQHESLLDSAAKDHQSQRTSWEQTQAQTKLEYDTQLSSLESKYETMLAQLRLEILQTNLDTDQLRGKVQALESGEASLADQTALSSRSSLTTPMPRRPRRFRSVGRLLALFLVILMASTLLAPIALILAIRYDEVHHATFLNEYLPMEYLTRDSLCAPTRAGTLLEGWQATAESPWWAPPEMKEFAFQFCDGYPRVRLSLLNGKIAAHRIEADNHQHLLWQEKARQAVVEQDEIILYNRKGHELKRLPSVWSSSSTE